MPKQPPRLQAQLFETFGEKKMSMRMFDNDSMMLNSSRAATTVLTRTPKNDAKRGGFFDETNNPDSDRTEKLSFEQEREDSLENH